MTSQQSMHPGTVANRLIEQRIQDEWFDVKNSRLFKYVMKSMKVRKAASE